MSRKRFTGRKVRAGRMALWIAASVVLAVATCELVLFVLLRLPAITAHMPGPLHELARDVYLYRARSIPQYQFGRYDPEVFATLQPGKFLFSGFEFANEFRVNSEGLRDSEEALREPEIIVLGDSYASGWGVEQEESFPKLIEGATKLRTLNAGLPGFGTVREMLLFNRLRTRRLKYLIIQYCNNDLSENISYYYKDHRYAPPPPEAYERAKEHATSASKYFPGAYLLGAWEAILDRPPPGHLPMPASEYFLNALIRENRKDLSHVQLIVVEINVPVNRRPGDDHLRDLEQRAAVRTNPDFIRKLRTIDLSNELDLNRHYYVLDDHLNREGHRLVADRIIDALSLRAK